MSNENYIGVTTGTVATACALAALKLLTNFKVDNKITIKTPKESLDIILDDYYKISNTKAIAKAHKFPYNDPDVTVNAEIIAEAEFVESDEKLIITGGEGIGKITKPGLQIPVGDYAINPGPRNMIKDNLIDLIPEDKSLKVTVSVPDGKNLASKTLNPKLGIVGGISILGTTGIARSMSSQAYKNSIVVQLDVAIASNINNLIFVPGNIGEKLAIKTLNAKKEQIIQTGNYIGFMFDEAKKRGIKEFTFFGHIGKLIKVAGGIFNTKHAIADGRCEIMITHAALNGANIDTIKKLYESKTTEEMLEILDNENLSLKVSNSIADAINKRCMDKFDLSIKTILVDMEGNFLNNNF